MANLVTYAKQKWEDAKTAITAARLNNMEDGIGNCAAQINALGDSVSRTTSLWWGSKLIIDMSEKANQAAVCVLSEQEQPPVTFVLWCNSAKSLTKSKIPNTITLENIDGVVTITASKNCFIKASVIKC